MYKRLSLPPAAADFIDGFHRVPRSRLKLGSRTLYFRAVLEKHNLNNGEAN